MDDMEAVELRLGVLERRLWALLMKYAEKRDFEVVREVLELIEVVERI